jgi:hypothetical protein
MITLEYDGDQFTFPNLSDHPVGWEETDTSRGRVARHWAISGIVSREDAKTVSDLFRAWQAERITDGDPKETGVVGTTVDFTGEAPGFEWTTAIPCWFVAAPTIEMAGIFCRVSLTVVDAEEALAVLLAELEDETKDEDELQLGTLSFGGAIVNLKARPEGYTDLPSIALNPSGRHVITGPFNPTQILRVDGWVDETNLPLLEQWVEDVTSATPATATWFLTEWSEPKADKRVQNGAMDIYYDVAFTVVKIR